MGDAEPVQILEDAADELGPAAAGVQILDPQSELAAACPRLGVAQRC
jgi:hypothetical protein